MHTHTAGVSSKGLPTELAMRVWQHIQLDALIQPDKCESNGATVANGAAAGKRSEPPAAASQLFLRRAREENVLVRMQGRPLKVGVERQGYRNLALTNTASECEALCAARPSCEAYTWFYADAPEAWSKSCIGQDLDVAKWSPFRSQVAVSGVKFYRSGLKLSTPRGRSIAASSSSPSWREPCARRMEVLPGKLDATLLQRAIAPVGANDGPHGCHFACLRDATCDRSVWVDPKGSSLLRHACFHLPPHERGNSAGPGVMINARRASSARKSAYAQPTWEAPYDVLARRLLDPAQLAEASAALARVARDSSVALIELHSEQLPLAKQFLCELKRLASPSDSRVLWLCGDTAACAFLEQNGLARLLPGEGGFGVSRRLRMALSAVLLGYNVVLADPGAVWLRSPWSSLSGPFDVIAAPEQRLAEGYGFPLGADFVQFRSTNASLNLLLELLSRVDATHPRSTREAATLLTDSLNDLLFLGMAANGSIVNGRFGAQMRRNDWSELRVKVLDMEAFPAAHVSNEWWKGARREMRSSRLVVLRARKDKRPDLRLRELKKAGAALPPPPRSTLQRLLGTGADECIARRQSAAARPPPPPIISVVMLSWPCWQHPCGLQQPASMPPKRVGAAHSPRGHWNRVCSPGCHHGGRLDGSISGCLAREPDAANEPGRELED